MTENEMMNGWTFEETVKTAENLMEAENNVFKWDVLRHLRDFAENYKDELEQYRAIGTIEEFKALKENQRKCEDCAGCTAWKCDCANIRAKAIDDVFDFLKNKRDKKYMKVNFNDLEIRKYKEQLKGGAT